MRVYPKILRREDGLFFKRFKWQYFLRLAIRSFIHRLLVIRLL